MKPLTLFFIVFAVFTSSSCTMTEEKWGNAMKSGGSYHYNKTLATDEFVSVVEAKETIRYKNSPMKRNITRLILFGNKYDLVLNDHDASKTFKPIFSSGLKKPMKFSTNSAKSYKYPQTLDDALVIDANKEFL